MQVRDIMTKAVVFAEPGMRVTEVAGILLRRRFHGMPVVKNGKIVGIITEDDFYIKDIQNLFLPSYISFLKEAKTVDNLSFSEKKKVNRLLNAKVADMMTPDCLTVSPDMDVDELFDIIKRTKFNTLPVADEKGNLIGIVTLVDVLGLLSQEDKLVQMSQSVKAQSLREVDQLAQEVRSFWGRTFVSIKKARVITWKGVFIVAFVAGAAIVLIRTFLNEYILYSSIK
jgi:CBS domain-containing protein